MFYVYVYLDPRPGKNQVPIYVGKGQVRKNKRTPRQRYVRAYIHLNAPREKNFMLRRLLSKIQELGLEPIVRIVRLFEEEVGALKYEKRLIARYGRLIARSGTLANITRGGDGIPGYYFTLERRLWFRKFHCSLWTEQRREEQSARMKSHYATNRNFCKQHMAHMIKTRWEDPLQRQQLAAQNYKNWADPAFRLKAITKIKAAAKRMSKEALRDRAMKAVEARRRKRKEKEEQLWAKLFF